MMKLLWIKIWWFLKKLNIKLLYDPVIPLLGKVKRGIQTKTYTQMFIAALFIVAKYGNKSNVHQWINKMWYIHTTEHYSAIKKVKYSYMLEYG